MLTDNNDIRVYTDGREKFDALLSEMDHARNYIHLQYYIIRNDELWQEIEEVLLRKARQGVEIRVLFDSMGCRGMKNSDWDRLEKAGIQVAEFFPGSIRKTAASCELPKPPEDCSDRWKNRLCRRI